MITQLAFDFSAGAAALPKLDAAARARAHWRIGMVTSLPLFAEIEGEGGRYTYMLPGVVEAIAGDLASVRIYAAPEYGYIIEDYPLHLALTVNVPLRDLGRHHWHSDLQRIVDNGLLATGDEALAAEVRVRMNSRREECTTH